MIYIHTQYFWRTAHNKYTRQAYTHTHTLRKEDFNAVRETGEKDRMCDLVFVAVYLTLKRTAAMIKFEISCSGYVICLSLL